MSNITYVCEDCGVDVCEECQLTGYSRRITYVCAECGSDLQEDQCNVAATDPVDSCPECEGTNLNTDATKCWDCSGQN